MPVSPFVQCEQDVRRPLANEYRRDRFCSSGGIHLHLPRNPFGRLLMPTLASSDLSSPRRRPTLPVVTRNPQGTSMCLSAPPFLGTFHRMTAIILWIRTFPPTFLSSPGVLHLGMIRSILFVMRYRPEHKIETHEK